MKKVVEIKKVVKRKEVVERKKFIPKKLYTATPKFNILVGKRLLTARVTYHDITKTELTTLKKNKAI